MQTLHNPVLDVTHSEVWQRDDVTRAIETGAACAKRRNLKQFLLVTNAAGSVFVRLLEAHAGENLLAVVRSVGNHWFVAPPPRPKVSVPVSAKGIISNQKTTVQSQPTARIKLTRTELAVLSYLSSPLSSDEIAQKMGIARTTVSFHCMGIYRKFDVKNRNAAVIRARELGFLQD